MKITSFRNALGPGLIMAGAAIGVSHLVQSTRAGAEYGLSLAVLVIVGCAVKYPFLEFGPRWAAATGENLLAGYLRLGRWALGTFVFLTLATMFIVLASVTLVTAGLTGLLFGLDASPLALAVLVLAVCMVILAWGQYRGLDRLMKIIMAVLALATLVALILAAAGTEDWSRLAVDPADPALWSGAGLAFVLALLGWMPIPLDAAAWHSLWTLERAGDTGELASVRHAGLDFRIGYVGATLMAVAFLALGALVMHGTGAEFSGSAVAFSGQLVELYAASLGPWARPLIGFAALATMFSTTLVVADAYPRVLRALLELRQPGHDAHARMHRARYLSALGLTSAGALAVIAWFGHAFTALIDFTTTVSFLAAPIIAALTFRLVTSRHMPADARPGPVLRGTAWVGMVFLSAFSLLWVAWRLGLT
ncbi:MAG: Nramp family divalent metal transporter [Wenzhouxiangellaceae bacterium]|nr:Nramp family divalent metal transporter [Wenzhouxiangellaceae bacterium]